MKKCVIKLTDEVNLKLDGLDPLTKRKVVESLKFMIPYARHTPAFKLGRWDGKKAFATAGGWTYINLLDRVLPILDQEGYQVELDDQRPQYNFQFPDITEDFNADICWPVGHVMSGQPIMMRDYQVKAVNDFLANPQSMQCLSTGSGKTICTATLSRVTEPYGRSMCIVPSKSLVEQTEEDYRNLGLDVGVYFGDRKEFGHTHTITTWQSLGILLKNSRAGTAEIHLDDFIDGVICIMVDEAHSAKADILLELLTGPLAKIPLRWGLTGTIPKDECDWLCLHAAIGPVVGEVRAAELQDKGVLANCTVEVMQLQDGDLEFAAFADERHWINSDDTRLEWVGAYCKALGETGNTLILVDLVDTGKYLESVIPDSVFVYGATKSKDRKKQYKEVQTSDHKVIIATYGVAAVGINIPRIFNLVLFEAGKSFVRTIQSIGRGIRKAEDKDEVNIVDLCSSLKFSARHLTKRKSFYREAQYPFKVKKVIYR